MREKKKPEPKGDFQTLDPRGRIANVADLLMSIGRRLESPNECDSNMETAYVTDGLYFVGREVARAADALERIAKLLEGKANP